MTKDVFVRLTGMQYDSQGGKPEPVEVISRGTYAKRNGKHYIIYDEVQGDMDQIIKNTIKIKDDCYEVIKGGPIRTHLCFEKGKSHSSFYETPYGSLVLQVNTQEISLEEKEEELNVQVAYELEVNYEKLADCRIEMCVQAKNDNNFSFWERN